MEIPNTIYPLVPVGSMASGSTPRKPPTSSGSTKINNNSAAHTTLGSMGKKQEVPIWAQSKPPPSQ